MLALPRGEAAYAALRPANVSLTNVESALVGSFGVGEGPVWTSNPPTYTCLEACALRYGGTPANYQCSVSGTTVTRTAYLSGYADGAYCTTPRPENFKVNTNYNCGSFGCSYSAYVLDNCQNGARNYCYSAAVVGGI
jgi:hypothetical protein